jgi:hypothetical protein
MKDYDSRRYQIGEDRISSRDQYRSGRRENKGNHKWVSVDWSCNNRVTPYRVFHIVFVHVYVGFIGDICIYVRLLKKICVHLGKHEILGSYSGLGVTRVCRCCLKFYVFFCGPFS